MERPAILLATLLGAGWSPVVPGTVGTLAAMPVALLAWRYLSVWAFVAATVLLAGAGIWASGVAARRLSIKDPGAVVVDEAAGLMVTLCGLPFGWPAAVLAFVFFRAMDILKPPPAGRLERLPGGYGIMLDDLMAGVYANLLVRLALRLWQAAG